MLKIILFFALGCLDESLVVGYYNAVSRRKKIRATALTLSMSFLGFYMVDRLVFGNRVLVLAFIIGQGVGAYLTMAREDRKFKKESE
jgi:hypothetical protein